MPANRRVRRSFAKLQENAPLFVVIDKTEGRGRFPAKFQAEKDSSRGNNWREEALCLLQILMREISEVFREDPGKVPFDQALEEARHIEYDVHDGLRGELLRDHAVYLYAAGLDQPRCGFGEHVKVLEMLEQAEAHDAVERLRGQF